MKAIELMNFKMLGVVFRCSVILMLISKCDYVSAQQREGDPCDYSDAERGVCTRKNLCRSLEEDTRRSRRPIFCTYKGIVDVICCKTGSQKGMQESKFPGGSTDHVELENIYDLDQLRLPSEPGGRKKHSITTGEADYSRRLPVSREEERNFVPNNNPQSFDSSKTNSKEFIGYETLYAPHKGKESGSAEDSDRDRREKRVWGQSINYDNFALYGTTDKPKPIYQQSLYGYQRETTTGRYQQPYYQQNVEETRDVRPKPVYQASWEEFTQRTTKVPYNQLITHRPTKSPSQYHQDTFTLRPTGIYENYTPRTIKGNHQEQFLPRPTKAPKPKPESNHNRPTENYNKPPENEHMSSGNYYNKPIENNGNWHTGNYYNKPTENYNKPSESHHNIKRPTESSRPSTPTDYHTSRPSYSHENFRPEHRPKPIYEPSSILFPNHEHEYHGQPDQSQHSQESVKPRPTRRPILNKISELKCKEYSSIVVETIAGLPLTTDPKPVEIQVQKCNHNAQQLIVGGQNSTAGEFPHMAAVGFINKRTGEIKWGCGGSLISETFILTAAHCTDIKYGSPGVVRLGELHLKRNDDGAHPVDYMVKEMIPHPDYRPSIKYNDIALLRLSTSVTFNIDVRPACLYTKSNFPVTKTVATGWGSPQYAAEPSAMLLKVVINIIDNHKCNSLYKAESKTPQLSRGIINSQMCAGDLNGLKDTCQGDSGGPIEITTKSNQCLHHIIGITSFGKRCGLPNAPGVYTRVSAYIPWIESVVWPDEATSQQQSR